VEIVNVASIDKESYVQSILILLDLPRKDEKELRKMRVDTLKRVFEGQRENALAYQALSKNDFDK
jgi:hypothetical protein